MSRWTYIMMLLALIAAGVSVPVVMGDRTRIRAEATGADAPLLPRGTFPVDDVSRVVLQRQNENRLVFTKASDGWLQVEPFEQPMDGFSIRSLVTAAADARARDGGGAINPDDLTESTAGLNPPAATVTYEWNGGSLTIDLGRRGMAGLAYLRVRGDQRIRIVNQGLHDRAVSMDVKEWRSRRLFTDVGPDLVRIERDDGISKLVLERDKKTWLMKEPAATRVDPNALDALLDALGRAEAAGYVLDEPQNLAQFGLNPPAGSLSIHGPGVGGAAPRVQTLLIGARVNVNSQDRFGMAANRPSVLRLSAAAMGALFRPAVDMIDLRACGVNSADAKYVVIRPKDGPELKFERDLERWLASEEGGLEVPAGPVNELMQQLTALQASAVEIGEYPREHEVATITLHGFDTRALTTIRVARDPGTQQWFLDNGDGVLRKYPAAMQIRMKREEYGLAPQ